MKDRYTTDELLYSATTRCECGAGVAYPRERKDAQELAAWVCSRVLTGEVTVSEAQPSDLSSGNLSPVNRVDTAGQIHIGLPWWCYSVKSEGQPSSHGATTRPAGSHVEWEPHCKCSACGHSYVAARRRPDSTSDVRLGGVDCPACKAPYLNADGSTSGKIDARWINVVVPS